MSPDTNSRPLPLADVRIIALEQYGAGPWGTFMLAELGADVIKIEDPNAGGEVGRHVPPAAEGDSLFFQTLNRGKRSIALDLTASHDRAIFERLVVHADAVYSNFRGDVPAKLGVTYADLAHLNPRIVCCSLSAFGMVGPRTAEPGYDYIVQALTGWMDLTGEPGSPPQKTGLSVVDWSGGYAAAISLMAAVHAARRDGVGADCDVALYDTAMSMLNYVGAWSLNGALEATRQPRSFHPTLVPFGNFPTADGWAVIGCAKEKFWQRLVEVFDDDALRDERFADFAGRRAHRDELVAIIDLHTSIWPTGTLIERLTAAGIPCAPVHTVAEALEDEQTVARGLVETVPTATGGTIRLLRSPVDVGGRRRPPTAAPKLDEHRQQLLDEIGWDVT